MKRVLTSLIFLAASGTSTGALSEALSTTSVGTGSRQLQWVITSATANAEENTLEKTLSGPILCHRVSAPSSIFTLEIGASGCLMQGSQANFSSSMSGHFTLLYYPFSSRMKVSNEDTAVRLKQVSFTNIFFSGKAGFSKTTYGVTDDGPISYTVDSIDVGMGLGYSYRFFKYVAIGIEGGYIYSSSMSPKVATGSSTTTEFLLALTTFL